MLTSAALLAATPCTQDHANYWQEAFGPAFAANWALLLAAVVTLIAVAWQARETRRAAKASQESVAEIKSQSAVLKQSVDAAEKNAQAAQDAATAAKANTDALINAERAWILADLGWYDGSAPRIAEKTLDGAEQAPLQIATANLKLTCRNEGRSPAWIDRVYGRIDIAVTRADITDHDKLACGNYGPMEPIGAGQEKCRSLFLESDGVLKGQEFFTIYVGIEYHDIFGERRETIVGYSLDSEGALYRQYGSPSRNRNT